MTRYNEYNQKPNTRKSVAADKRYKALPPGKRVSKRVPKRNAPFVPAHTRKLANGKKIKVAAHYRTGGKAYSEHRQNRSDHRGSRV